MIDHWLSTETLQVIHFGAPLSRIEKVAAISTWQPASNSCVFVSTRVIELELNNCCKCEKCIRTMVMLEICGTLKYFKTFRQPFGRWDIIRWVPHYDFGRGLAAANSENTLSPGEKLNTFCRYGSPICAENCVYGWEKWFQSRSLITSKERKISLWERSFQPD